MRKPSRAQRCRYPVRELVERLEAVYGRAEIVGRFSPMDELVSCILTQHTTDASAFAAFDQLRAAYPTWQEVVDAGPERIADVVRMAGLANQKARSIIACLREIKQRQGEYSIDFLKELPMLEARDWLTSLPGVGPKTASIVLCFAFGMDAIPVDTHVYRVSWRLGLVPEGVGEAKSHDLLLEAIPQEFAYRYHVALIQHGRQVCKAPLPLCEQCVVTDLCAWYKAGGPQKKRTAMARERAARRRT